MKHWLKQNLIAVDQLVNTLVFLGWADETLSSRSWRARHKYPFIRITIDILFFPIERKHCYKSYLSERERLQEPVELRTRK
jgi:hypothetical protein